LCLVVLGFSSVCAFAQLPPPPPLQPPPGAARARDTPPATGTAIIRGRVIAAGSDHALAHVEVRAVSGPSRVNRAVLTDANGRYEISELPAGRYTVTTNKSPTRRPGRSSSR